MDADVRIINGMAYSTYRFDLSVRRMYPPARKRKVKTMEISFLFWVVFDRKRPGRKREKQRAKGTKTEVFQRIRSTNVMGYHS